MKNLFRLSLLFDDIVFEDYFFETEDEAVNFGNEFLENIYKIEPVWDIDRYSAIVVPVKGVIL